MLFFDARRLLYFGARGEAHGAHGHGVDAEGPVALGVEEREEVEGFAALGADEVGLDVDAEDVAVVGWGDCQGFVVRCL